VGASSVGPTAACRPFGRRPNRVPKAVRRRPSSRQTNSPLLRHSPTLAAWSGSREEVRHGAPRRIREPPHLSSRQVSGGEGYPSETKVRRGLRVVHGDKELAEKLGRNDLCPCGSRKRFQELLHAFGRLRRQRAARLLTVVWPGAVLVEGEMVGTWRRAQTEVTVWSWRRLSPAECEAVEAEAATCRCRTSGRASEFFGTTEGRRLMEPSP